MDKPYVIYHMITSIDGKITGGFSRDPRAVIQRDFYYSQHRDFKAQAFMCGRVTMQGSFTGEALPDLSAYAGVKCDREDYVARQADFYAVALDTSGKLNWQKHEIEDEDPGYDKAHIIEVLKETVADEYIAFLKDKGISYIFAGHDELDLKLMLHKLKTLFGIEKLLLEGGGIIGGTFAKENLIDELSIVVAPLVQGENAKELFAYGLSLSEVNAFALKEAKPIGEGVWMRYDVKTK